MPGPETTYASIGAEWANVANTPFRFWKAKSYEGGICTPMIAFWPKGIGKKRAGSITEEAGHVMDIMATCVELADAEYPETYKGHDIIPMEGMGLVPIFRTGHRKGHEYLGFEHFNECAFLSAHGWKIVKPGNCITSMRTAASSTTLLLSIRNVFQRWSADMRHGQGGAWLNPIREPSGQLFW